MEVSTKTLAQGSFGKIYKQKYNDTWAAVKKVPVGYIKREQLFRECRVYSKAHHNNVVRLLGEPWLEDGRWNIPLEFIFGEELETSIFNVQKSQISLTPAVKTTIISGMCEGLYHLHSNDIVHQDLKPDNVMIEHGSHRAVIIDLGLAKFFVDGKSSAQNLGNPAYSAPEIWEGNVRDKRSDVWAMGKIIGELCARVRLPTNFLTPLKVKEILKDSPYSGVVPKMVVTNATERATMAEVIGEIRHLGTMHGAGAGTGRPNPVLGMQGCIRGKLAAEPGPMPRLRHPTPFPLEARHHELHFENINQNPLTRLQALVPAPPRGLAPNFADMSMPCPIPPDGTVIHRRYEDNNGQMQYKEIVTKNGKLVRYEDVKFTK